MQTACDIPERQNREGARKLIAAWSHLYGHAKVIAGWQFILSVPAALAMSLLALRWPELKIVTTPLSLLFGWIDILLLDRIQNGRKKLGAQTQEAFDCDVLGLDWNEVRCSPKPESEVVNEAAEDYRCTGDISGHPNWYPTEVGRLPLPLARLICQRAAVWWDMSQRRRYANWLVGIVAGLVIGVVAVSFTANHLVRDMVLSVYVPIAPAVVWAFREFRRQREAVAGLEKLKARIENFYADAIRGRKDAAALLYFSRSVQDMIFDGRSKNPLLFNTIYRLWRKKNELRMNEKAEEMVKEAVVNAEAWRF